jgi:hypothetical protein
MVGHRRQEPDGKTGLAYALGDALSPVGVDLPRQVDAPGAVAVGHSLAPFTTSASM